MKTLKLIIRIPIGILLGLIMLVGGYSAIPIGFLLTFLSLGEWLRLVLKPTLSDYEKKDKQDAVLGIIAWPVYSFLTAKQFILTGTMPD